MTKPATPLPYGTWPGYSVRTIEKSANGVDVEITSMALLLDGHTASFNESMDAVRRANAYPELVAALRQSALLIGNVDHSKGNGPNAAAMRGEMLNVLRDRFSALLAKLGEA